MITVPLVRLSHGAGLPLPSYATSHSAGVDLMAAVENSILLKSLERKLVPTGISVALPVGYEAQIRPRSGLALKHGITVLNSPGTIDADYRGEIQVLLINLSPEDFVVDRGLRLAQMVLSPVFMLSWKEVEHHADFAHNDRRGGFGSTGLRRRL